MANNINLEELRAQRAGRVSKASEEAVEKFIETGEVTPEPVEIDPRQQSFFKEEPAVEEASAVETVVQEKVSEESVVQQSPVQRFIQEETQKEAENEEVESTNMSEMELYSLLKNNSARRRDSKKKDKVFKTYSVSLPCALVELIDKMAANRYMTRSSVLTICLMNGLELEFGIDAKKSLPLPLKS